MSAVPEEDRDDGESQWQFGLDEVGEDADPDTSEPIEPETLSVENAAFVVLGVALSLLIFYAALVGL